MIRSSYIRNTWNISTHGKGSLKACKFSVINGHYNDLLIDARTHTVGVPTEAFGTEPNAKPSSRVMTAHEGGTMGRLTLHSSSIAERFYDEVQTYFPDGIPVYRGGTRLSHGSAARRRAAAPSRSGR